MIAIRLSVGKGKDFRLLVLVHDPVYASHGSTMRTHLVIDLDKETNVIVRAAHAIHPDLLFATWVVQVHRVVVLAASWNPNIKESRNAKCISDSRALDLRVTLRKHRYSIIKSSHVGIQDAGFLERTHAIGDEVNLKRCGRLRFHDGRRAARHFEQELTRKLYR